MQSLEIKQYTVQSLIDDLNYATLIEACWIVEVVDLEVVEG